MSIYYELGRYPLYINRYCRVITFWCNLVQSDNIILQTLLWEMVDDLNKGKHNFLSDVKKLLDDYSFSYVWSTKETVDLKKCFMLFLKSE